MKAITKNFGFEPRTSFGDVMSRNRGVGPGFDFIRLGLSTVIFYLHCQFLAGTSPTDAIVALDKLGKATATTAAPSFTGRPVQEILLPMFFAVSGFLVTGSAVRLKSTVKFLWFRVLRLIPALATEITLSALILGPLLTSYTLEKYFTDYRFYTYFLNIIGDVHFHLPGLFDKNPVDIVNINLWTLPAEFYCYFFTTIGMVTTLVYKPKLFTGALIVASCLIIPISILTGYGEHGRGFKTLGELVYYFFIGVAFYQWRDYIPFKFVFGLSSLIISYVLLALGQKTTFLAPIFVCYSIIYIGMLPIPQIPLLQRGDYSYGIYLYGFPICQAVLALAPALQGHSKRLFVPAYLITLIFAAMSWHWIEKPSLRLKKAFTPKVIPIDPVDRAIDIPIKV